VRWVWELIWERRDGEEGTGSGGIDQGGENSRRFCWKVWGRWGEMEMGRSSEREGRGRSLRG